MSDDIYGLDVAALDSLPDPEVTCEGNVAAAFSIGRRWLTPTGALEEIGETEQYDSIDVRDWLGQRFNLNDPATLRDLESQAKQCALDDPYCDTIDVTAVYGAGMISLTGSGNGAAGPFKLVLKVSSLTVQLLSPGVT